MNKTPRSLTYAVVIPARYKSSRFPGKPLADIHGKPMIQHVWERCVQAVGNSNVFVATDDARIFSAVENFGGHPLLTPETSLTGTDRIAEANKILNRDFVINVQGDEPMINPSDIALIRDRYLSNPNIVVNAYTPLAPDENPASPTLPKVVVSKGGYLMYMSRAPIPASKDGTRPTQAIFKQVCIYAFSREHLEVFSAATGKTPNEAIEDIEILRFLENDIRVQMVRVKNTGRAVDTPEDLEIVKRIMSQ